MKSTDIVRQILDLIDSLDDGKDSEPEFSTQDPDSEETRFRQINRMLNTPDGAGYDNEPTEIVTDLDSVTVDAGGGVNAPRHPDDIRVKDPRGYE